jgi:uncharacterized membrane protein YgcG
MELGTAEWVRKMEPVMAHRQTDNNGCAGRTAKAVLPIVLACLAPFLFAAAVFGAGERERMFQDSGIRYPDGYDVHTVGEVQGRAENLDHPNKGPVSFDLRTKFEIYRVIASPPWYWEDLRVHLADGDKVRVIGSKSLGNDGKLYIIAQEIYLASGQSVVLRDKDGTALWKGGPRSGFDRGSGWGSSSSSGRGGIGSGSGGGTAGRGRR